MTECDVIRYSWEWWVIFICFPFCLTFTVLTMRDEWRGKT